MGFPLGVANASVIAAAELAGWSGVRAAGVCHAVMERDRRGRAGRCGLAARSVALAGFGLDSLIEIGALAVVIWELRAGEADRRGGPAADRDRIRVTGGLPRGAVDLGDRRGVRTGHSPAGIAWTTLTAAVMFALACGKARTGTALGNPILVTEGRVTLIEASWQPP